MRTASIKNSLKNYQGFRPFLTASVVSNVGTEITGIALPLVAITLLNASNSWVAVIEGASSVALMLVGLQIGLLVDRRNKRTLLITSDLIGAATIASIPILWLTGSLNTVWVLLAAVILAIAGNLHDVASDTVMPSIVPRKDLGRANGVYASSRSVAEVSGAGIGGIIISGVGLFAGLIMDALSFVASAVLLMRLPHAVLGSTHNKAEPEETIRATTVQGLKSSWKDMIEGFTIYKQDVRLRYILGSSLTSNIFSTMAGMVELLFLIRVLEVPAWGVGLAVSVTAVGGIMGGVMNNWLLSKLGPHKIMAFSQLVLNAPILLLPFAFSGIGVTFYVIAWFFYSLSSVIYASAVITYRQTIVPEQLLGRVGATSRWINSVAIAGTAAVTAILLLEVSILTIVTVSSVGIYISGFWLLNKHFLQPAVQTETDRSEELR